ncbi:MAG: type IX secretion system sortase PorU, partial [Bacteroidales bacterium]|nr:type IX secretion system sortase PorU [Candidatus Latescibacterota bacterium]
MRKIQTTLLLLLIPTILSAGEYRILHEDNSSVTVEFSPARPLVEQMGAVEGGFLARIAVEGYMPERVEGRPVLPVQRYFFQVPAVEGIRFQVLDVDLVMLDGILPEVWFSGKVDIDDHLRALRDRDVMKGIEHAILAGTGTMSRRKLALVDIYPVIWDPGTSSLGYAERIVVRLSFAPQEISGKTTGRRGFGDSHIINADQAAGWIKPTTTESSALRTPFEFSLADDWLKLKIADTGVYVVTYTDILSAGLDPGEIDPATIRVFTGGPLQQPAAADDGGSFEDDYHLDECAVLYRGDNSGSFSPGDSIIFYAPGIEGWMNDLDPSADVIEWYEHDYAENSNYWLSWGHGFAGQPLRMEERDVSIAGVTPDLDVTTYEERIHREEDNLYDPKYTEDRWYWRSLGAGSSSFTDNFTLDSVVGNGRFRTLGYGPYNSYDIINPTYYINGAEVGTLACSVAIYSFDPETLDVAINNLVNSTNTFRVVKEPGDMVYVLWYEIYYERYLNATGGELNYFSPDEIGQARFQLNGFSTGERFLFDVTSFKSPVLLTHFSSTAENITYIDGLSGSPAHYFAMQAHALRHPEIERYSRLTGSLVSLRDEPACPNMVIIYNSRFEAAASELALYRSSHLPLVEDPLVKAVDVRQIYDNFSGGMKDPVAIRNYLKFLYDNFDDGIESEIKYALLMGNGTYDTKDILGTGIDYVPLYVKDYGREMVEDDDFFARLDGDNDRLIDLGLGRMTVLSASEASAWVRNIIAYEADVEPGAWKNKVMLVADDEFSANTNCDYSFMIDTEYMSQGYTYFPDFIDLKKIYLHHYPFSGDLKPEASNDLLDGWNDGALIVKYTGHGSPQQMADERVMQKSDVYSLRNGDRRPLFLAFSCSVGNIESPYQRSIAQEMVVRDDGGAIATITGTGGTLGIPNRELCFSLFKTLFTSEDSTGTWPLGTTMMLAKPCCAVFGDGMNNSQYILLGDPAMMLAMPGYTVEHEVSTIDTMLTGARYTLDGRVMSGGAVLTSFNGNADIIVQESFENVNDGPITCYYGYELKYYLPGKEIFRGSVDVSAGRFNIDFVIPIRCKTGPEARVRSYVTTNGEDGVGAEDSLLIVSNPDIPQNSGPPSINIFFSGQATKVKQGASLNVEISDDDGIAILGSDPQSSIFLEFDRSGYPIFVTDYFTYDHGSSTTGRVEYPLHSGFSPGPHSVIVRAFDNLGESSTDTLAFDVVEEGLYTVSDVFNMPNPFTETTNFVFQLSNDADVVLRVYNVSGREIWSRKTYGEEGFNSIYWDGRDYGGDRPANGTYLYLLDVSFRNSYNRCETVSGKAVLLR